LYRVDFSKKDLPRTLKQGAHYYRDVMKEFTHKTESSSMALLEEVIINP